MRHGFRLVEQAEWDNYYVRSPSSTAEHVAQADPL
jgi:hypothetical protein